MKRYEYSDAQNYEKHRTQEWNREHKAGGFKCSHCKRSPRYHCSRCHVPSVQSWELHEQFLHLLSSLAPDPDMEKFLKEIIVRMA